jgi:hypothetical protein
MKVQLDSSITGGGAISQPIPGAAPAGKPPEPPKSPETPQPVEGAADGIRISIASTALNQLSTDRNEKIGRVTASVQGGSYQTSSVATSTALVEHALSGSA